MAMESDLESHGLSELVKKQCRDLQWSRHGSKISGSFSGIGLKSIQGTKKRGVGIGLHQPGSSASSSARMAATSSMVKTRLPHVSRNLAMMSTLGRRGRSSAVPNAGTSVAMTFPRLRMLIDSPSRIHASMRENSFRSSRTVAVFMRSILYLTSSLAIGQPSSRQGASLAGLQGSRRLSATGAGR